MTKVLCYGYYGKDAHNIGDELFKDSFRYLFPEINFTFTDHITIDLLKDYDAVFIGGGSFLNLAPNITEDALTILKDVPIFFLGVGAETEIHETYQQLLKQAKLVAIRSPHIDKIKAYNDNVIQIPDLVYSLVHQNKQTPPDKSILYLPNALLLPKWNDPHWMHISWEYWKLEAAQTFDYLIEQGYSISTFPMCEITNINDNNASTEVLNMMHSPNKVKRISKGPSKSFKDIATIFSNYQIILTQRYHGSIIAEMIGRPYISIFHHDKLNNTHYNAGSFISFFETSKAKLLNEINNVQNQRIPSINPHSFEALIVAVNKWIDGLGTTIKTSK